MASLCAALSRCSALVDLHFGAEFVSANGELLVAEQGQVAWAALLSSVPNLHRLCVGGDIAAIAPFLAVLPLHLPHLEELSLSGCGPRGAPPYVRMAHPNLRLLELGPSEPPPPSEEEVQAWMGSARLPKLERYIRHL
jgi:hypothetical protein